MTFTSTILLQLHPNICHDHVAFFHIPLQPNPCFVGLFFDAIGKSANGIFSFEIIHHRSHYFRPKLSQTGLPNFRNILTINFRTCSSFCLQQRRLVCVLIFCIERERERKKGGRWKKGGGEKEKERGRRRGRERERGRRLSSNLKG